MWSHTKKTPTFHWKANLNWIFWCYICKFIIRRSKQTSCSQMASKVSPSSWNWWWVALSTSKEISAFLNSSSSLCQIELLGTKRPYSPFSNSSTHQSWPIPWRFKQPCGAVSLVLHCFHAWIFFFVTSRAYNWSFTIPVSPKSCLWTLNQGL